MAEIRAGKSLLGQGGLLTPLIKNALEATLEGEMDSHIADTRDNNNRRNGKSKKIVKPSAGTFELETPRDRDGNFEPEIVKKLKRYSMMRLMKKFLAYLALA